MNHYETAFLLTPNLADKDVEQFTAEMRGLLEKHGATDVGEGRVERRALSYPVKKHNEGYYLYIPFAGPAAVPSEMRTELRHREELLRFTFVRRPEPSAATAAQPEAAAHPETAPVKTTPQPEAGPEPTPAAEAPADPGEEDTTETTDTTEEGNG